MNLIPDTINWADYEKETEEAAKIRPASDFLDVMIAQVGEPEESEPRCYLPWDKTHEYFAFRQGEVTLWAGVNGHGKSLVTGMASVSMIVQNEKVCIASFEMKPRKTLRRMATQFMGQSTTPHHPDEIPLVREVLDQFRGLCTDRLWVYDQQGTVTPERVIAVTRYCFKELGIKHMFIDSLMKCVKGEDDYNGQKALLDELCALARDHSAHIHLVHHLRKSGKETDQPDKNDVKGSGSITDQVDNLLLVWRNKQKEMDYGTGKQVDPLDPDVILFCRKQRNGTGWEGAIKLYFNSRSMQYTANPGYNIDLFSWPHRETQG
jgi:twinkle protein